MKYFIISLFITLNLYAQEFLTSAQKEKTLLLLDNICGDTWCEGDYNYEFDKISCDQKSSSCTVDFLLIETVYSNDTDINDPGKNFCFASSCKIENVDSYNKIVKGNELTDYFYTSFGDCSLDKEIIFPQNKTPCE